MGINQVLVRNDVGMTFAAALKAFLRQDRTSYGGRDPRSRDRVDRHQGALTGHWCSPRCTPTTRLHGDAHDRHGDEPFNVASAVNLIVAQRLVRRVCSECKQEHKYSDEEIHASASPAEAAKLTFYKGAGCDTCSGSGYKGRQGLYEVWP